MHRLSLLYDLIQVISSIADVALDLLVLHSFHEQNLPVFFYTSLAIFLLAQVSYALLFTATLGRQLTTIPGFVLTFCLTLPLAQLVPIFTWLESFHFPIVDTTISRLGLRPTNRQVVDDDNLLFNFFTRKLHSNAGFLVEAICEAFPQALLQTTAVVMTGQASLLTISSIFLSLFVICSKGYLFSFSVHTPTLVFNCLCLTFDVSVLFAAFVWASLLPADSPLALAWQASALAVALLITLSCACLVWFSCCDDHLKIALKERFPSALRLPTGSVFFDIYLVRTGVCCVNPKLTFCLAILTVTVIPATALTLLAKACWVPLVVLGTVHPEQGNHPEAFAKVYRYLDAGGPSQRKQRLLHLNKLLRLMTMSGTLQSCPFGRLCEMRNKKAIAEVLRGLGGTEFIIRMPSSRLVVTRIVDLPSDPDKAALVVKQDNYERRVIQTRDGLERRSQIWWWLAGAKMTEQHSWPRYAQWQLDDWLQRALRVLGTLFLSGFVASGLCLAVCSALCMTISLALAAIEPVLLGGNEYALILGQGLSFVALVSAAVLMGLYPSVREFAEQEMVEIVNPPAGFYSVLDVVSAEAFVRYRRALGQEKLLEFLRAKTNPDCTTVIQSYWGSEQPGF